MGFEAGWGRDIGVKLAGPQGDIEVKLIAMEWDVGVKPAYWEGVLE